MRLAPRFLATLPLLAAPALAHEPDAGSSREAAPPGSAVVEVLDAGTPIPPVHVTVAAPQVKLGFGEGVTVQYGDMKLNLRGRVQVQAVSVIPGESSTAHRQSAIFVRRARLALKGDRPWHLAFYCSSPSPRSTWSRTRPTCCATSTSPGRR
jgi:hypothetical protein